MNDKKEHPKDEDRMHENSDAVQAHLNIAQSVINRMASNSAFAKGWCIAITSAVLVLVADAGRPNLALIALIPVTLFLALDAYYLALEKRFRNSYNAFIEKLHQRGIAPTDLYAIVPSGRGAQAAVSALTSFSVWPFYVALLIMVLLTWRYIL